MAKMRRLNAMCMLFLIPQYPKTIGNRYPALLQQMYGSRGGYIGPLQAKDNRSSH